MVSFAVFFVWHFWCTGGGVYRGGVDAVVSRAEMVSINRLWRNGMSVAKK